MNGSLVCEICNDKFIMSDEIESCRGVDCSSDARAHMCCIKESEPNILHGAWLCDECTSAVEDVWSNRVIKLL
jgi:hypothetical protein